MINKHKTYCYRITHISNLSLLLQNGIVNKHHPNASQNYVDIGNPEIIDVRSAMPVKISNYGMIGDYVPFYFTPKSMMLFNIITGYRHPLVLKRNRSEILVIRCLINDLATLSQWFFTDGQGNDMASNHYNNLTNLEKIDWQSIQNSDFSKTDGDYDRPRRYQAEFLIFEQVPLIKIESLNVYNKHSADIVTNILNQYNINLAVNIQPQYFF
ncbi:type II toxin-antitoxin system toxin DNA ADP-ribosyl transferase DarT [Chryseobacterium populi]|uniref:DarT domain-containing protein n=1 Tax=Chryseobacterium populi TaxID=1144316 RepID=J3CH43_9FLAO|nr:DUF4433 domain-containing protein [Chryseobacterium populi]EJL71281.1 hypothetical protein PMI13_02411 [Chryseobacterium populi]